MNWRDEYKKKLVSAQEGAEKIKTNDVLVIGGLGQEPRAVLQALAERRKTLSNITIYQMLNFFPHSIFNAGMEEVFTYNSMYLNGPARKVVQEGRGTYTPVHFSHIPHLLGNEIPVDWCITGVTSPNEHGYFSFSVGGCPYNLQAARRAKNVMMCVNKNLPFVCGDTMMHVSEVTSIVEEDYPIPLLPNIPPSDAEKKIGEYISRLIEDGSTIQLGFGGVPNAVAEFLSDKRDLGVHTEMICPSMIKLFKEGVITNRNKSFHRNVMIGSFALGDQELYDFVRENNNVEFYPITYTNVISNIAKNNKMVSINGAIEVDLTGQVCAESIGPLFYSGTGGIYDFARGVLETEDGKGIGIIAFESTTKNDAISKIVSTLRQGAVVSVPRMDVDHIVTEYGVAKLRGKSARDRANALINIAHPNFRDKLRQEANKIKLL
jgi:4-hydroxybutyrate CoA-transferase